MTFLVTPFLLVSIGPAGRNTNTYGQRYREFIGIFHNAGNFCTCLSYKIIPEFRIYGEYAHIGTADEKIKKEAPNYLAPESKYMKPGKHYNPFYFGAEFAPKDGVMSILMSNLYLEWERIGDRQEVHDSKKKMDDWAWTLAWAKKIGQSKLQFSLYSGNEMSDLGLAFRLTSTFK